MNTVSQSTRTLIVGLTLMLVMSSGWGAELRAYFDRNPVYVGETVTLTIEASGTTPSGYPDLSPLSRGFTVLGTSQGSEVRIVNGRRSATSRWQIRLRHLASAASRFRRSA